MGLGDGARAQPEVRGWDVDAGPCSWLCHHENDYRVDTYTERLESWNQPWA